MLPSFQPQTPSIVDTDTFVNYYTRRFESDLRRFFDFSMDFGDGTYPFVLEMPSGVTNLQRGHVVWDNLNHYYMFSAAEGCTLPGPHSSQCPCRSR